VRDYTSTNPWTWVVVHPRAVKNLNWRRQVYDLTNFSGQDFRGKQIEIAFQVISVDPAREDGWYIDDIAVEENNPRIYQVGFYDDVENGPITSMNFLNECNWHRSSTTSSGSHGWRKQPRQHYLSRKRRLLAGHERPGRSERLWHPAPVRPNQNWCSGARRC